MTDLTIVPVITKKERKEFVEYPLRLYKNNPYFVPPFYADEMNLFTAKNIYQRTCLSSFFLAKRGKETVGRIQGIIQKQYNAIRGQTQARFTRFDCEDNPATAKALFEAVEGWAKEQGMPPSANRRLTGCSGLPTTIPKLPSPWHTNWTMSRTGNQGEAKWKNSWKVPPERNSCNTHQKNWRRYYNRLA